MTGKRILALCGVMVVAAGVFLYTCPRRSQMPSDDDSELASGRSPDGNVERAATEPRDSDRETRSRPTSRSGTPPTSGIELDQSTVGNDESSFEGLLTGFKERHREYLRKVQDAAVNPGALGYSGLWRYHTSKLDAEVKGLILKATETYSDFDSVRKALGDPLDIQEVPQEIRVVGGVCDEARLFFCSEPVEITVDAFRPIVMFKRSVFAGGTVYACQNAFLTTVNRENMLVRGEPYSLIQTGSDVIPCDVMNEYPNDSICPPITELPHVIVDLIDVGEPFPVALCVAGPQGRGLFVSMETYEFSQTNKSWQPRGFGGEWGGISGWRYSTATRQFGLFERGSPDTEEINVLDGLLK